MKTGAVALLGSGEYTAAMDTTDLRLIETLGSRETVRVALLPTASSLEPGSPERWNRMGERHFARLGASATPIWLLERAHALDSTFVTELAQHRMIYFSGGSPDHIVEVLHETPVWHALRTAWYNGAVIAGCSAGAMMLGECTLSVRAIRNGQPPHWRPALGLLPHLAVMPHFDRMRGFMSDAIFEQALAAAPPALQIVGIDEDTALLWLPGAQGTGHWEVSGRQTVTVIDTQGYTMVYQAGAQVPLPGI
jgi:cyanophycinase